MLKLPALFRGVHQVSDELADLVGDLQKFLLGLEYRLVVDENFGPKTEAEVEAYQRTEGIVADGRVGPTTWGHLLADGFRPKQFQGDLQGYSSLYPPNWPEKPAGAFAPNGRELFGQGFTYTPKPLPSMPEYVVPDPTWVRNNIGTAHIPQLMGVRGSREDGTMLFNKLLIPQVEALFSTWEKLGLIHYVETFAGSWVPRYIRGRRDKLSNHSFGSAFDINAAWNGYRQEPALGGSQGSVRPLVETAYKFGFYWGGWYNDGMHFEAYKHISAEELKDIQ